MRICEKKVTFQALEISPQQPHCPNIGPKKRIQVEVHKELKMICALEVKPYTYNNEDPYEKIHQFKYWNCLN